MGRRLWALLLGFVALEGALGQESTWNVQAVEIAASSTLVEAGHGGRYAAHKAFDGDPASCWVEGKSDNGIGENVRLVLDREITVDAILLMPGVYLPEYHTANNRIKKLKVVTEGSSFVLSCEDAMKPQRFFLNKPIRFRSVRFEVVEVYPGSEWADTCLSEVAFYFAKERIWVDVSAQMSWRGEAEGSEVEVEGRTAVLIGRRGRTTADTRTRLLPAVTSTSVRYTDYGGDGKTYEWVPAGREVYVVGRTLGKEQVGEWNAYWYLVEVPTDEEGSVGQRWMYGEFVRLGEQREPLRVVKGAVARPAAKPLPSLGPFVMADSGSGHSFAMRADGTLWAWGQNRYGQLGDGTFNSRSTPVRVGTDADWALVASSLHAAALKRDGTVWAWGWNEHGQLGDGSTQSRSRPMRVGTDADWASVAAGGRHTVGLKRDGTLWAWGYNFDGQLGDGSTETRLTPVRVGNDADWASVAAGWWHTVAIKRDGTLWAWGNNEYGRLGIGSQENRRTPVRVGRDADWARVAAGGLHSVGLKRDGTLWAWGDSRLGQLGIDTTSSYYDPRRVGRDADWALVAAGGWHTVALKRDGTLWAWGANGSGQLGDGSTQTRLTPVRVGTDANWISVAAGGDSTVALKRDRTLWVWGENESGQLGDGSTADRSTPVRVVDPVGDR